MIAYLRAILLENISCKKQIKAWHDNFHNIQKSILDDYFRGFKYWDTSNLDVQCLILFLRFAVNIRAAKNSPLNRKMKRQSYDADVVLKCVVPFNLLQHIRCMLPNCYESYGFLATRKRCLPFFQDWGRYFFSLSRHCELYWSGSLVTLFTTMSPADKHKRSVTGAWYIPAFYLAVNTITSLRFT